MNNKRETIKRHDHDDALYTDDFSFIVKMAENRFFYNDESIKEKFSGDDCKYYEFLKQETTFRCKSVYGRKNYPIKTQYSSFELCQFNGDFFKCDFSDTYFLDCDFINVNFNDIYIQDSSFVNCTFTNCTFEKTSLRKCFIGKCNFYDSNFINTIIDFCRIKHLTIKFHDKNCKITRKRVESYKERGWSIAGTYAIATTKTVEFENE